MRATAGGKVTSAWEQGWGHEGEGEGEGRGEVTSAWEESAKCRGHDMIIQERGYFTVLR